MIQRGTRLSRTLAVLVAIGPAAAAVATFLVWSADRWADGAARLAAEEQRIHETEARASQASYYEPLGEAWRAYADTEISGLSQAPDAAAAQSELEVRISELFQQFDGGARVAPLPPETASPRLQRVRAETLGDLPEEGLSAFLEALETRAPFLFVDWFEARPVAVEGEEEARVSLRMVISLLRLEDDPS